MVKHLPKMQETGIRTLGQKDPLENEMATYSSILAWKIPWMGEPGSLNSTGSQRIGHNWTTSLSFLESRIDLICLQDRRILLDVLPFNSKVMFSCLRMKSYKLWELRTIKINDQIIDKNCHIIWLHQMLKEKLGLSRKRKEMEAEEGGIHRKECNWFEGEEGLGGECRLR